MKAFISVVLVLLTPVIFTCKNQSGSEKSTGSDGMGQRDMYLIEDDDDEKFIREAGSACMMEVELGKYAGQKANNQRVKKFGEMMAEDHSNANTELQAMAQMRNIPISMEERHSRIMTGLQGKSGNEFDREYLREMVNVHQEDLDKFKKQAERSKNPDVRAFASKNVLVFQLHLDSAKLIIKQLK